MSCLPLDSPAEPSLQRIQRTPVNLSNIDMQDVTVRLTPDDGNRPFTVEKPSIVGISTVNHVR